MTKKVHAKAFRLGITQFWDFAPFSFFDRVFVFLYAWITGFFQRKRLYLINWSLDAWEGDRVTLKLQYFSRRWGLKVRRARFRRFRRYTRKRKLRWLPFRWSIRPLTCLSVKFLRYYSYNPLSLFARKFLVRPHRWERTRRFKFIWMFRRFRLFLARRQFPIYVSKLFLKAWARQVRGRFLVTQKVPVNFVRRFFYWRLSVIYLWYIRLLRFCTNMSVYCSHLIGRNVVVLPVNVYAKLFAKFRGLVQRKPYLAQSAFHFLITTLRRDLFAFRFIQGFRDFLYVVVLAGKYKESFLLRQWLKYFFEPVRKHALNVSHNRLLKFIAASLTDLQSVAGFLRGFRFEVRGKINGSLRTRTRFYGAPVTRQTLDIVTHYNQYSVKTFTGVLSFRFWLF